MSSIGSVVATSYTPQSTPTGGVQGTPRVSRSRSEEDEEGKKVHRHGHHGHERGERVGSMQDALMQALKSLGLPMPQGRQGDGSPAATTDGTTPTSPAPAAPAPSGTASAPPTTAPVAPPPMRHGEHEDHEEDDDDDDHQRSAVGGIQADLRQFMHALFQAVKGLGSESGTTTTANSTTNTSTGTATGTGTGTGSGTGAATGAGTPATNTPTASTHTFPAPRFHGGEHSHGHRRHFAAGLAALISQIGNGSAPPALQSAFDKLVADLQGASGTPPASGTGSAPATGSAGATGTSPTPPAPATPPATDTSATTGTSGASGASGQSSSSSTAVTLQALLSKLQQGLGYGAMGHRAAIGNLVNVTAG